MQIPTEWRIMGRTIKTCLIEDHDPDVGRYHGDSSTMAFQKSLVDDPPQCLELMIHEVLHACWDASSLADQVNEETAVRALSRGLLAVMRDNPLFVAAIVDACEAI